jgi:hypothetical protein
MALSVATPRLSSCAHGDEKRWHCIGSGGQPTRASHFKLPYFFFFAFFFFAFFAMTIPLSLKLIRR